jgi:hypothetical protein
MRWYWFLSPEDSPSMTQSKAFTFVVFLIGALLTWTPFCRGQNPGLFESDEILELRLKGNFDLLFRNTKGEPVYFDFTVLAGTNSEDLEDIPLRVRTRGHFRREMNICDYPPLLLNFAKEDTKNSIFEGQDKLKLVVPCKGEKYVAREFYVYKLYNLLSDKSFKARLVRLTIEDLSDKKIKSDPLLCFLIEEEESMAKRNQMISIDRDLIQPKAVEIQDFHRVAVFQYLIGNTDWSIQYRQNIKLISSSEVKKPIPVPYDFDHAGIVRAPYAKPAPELKLATVTDRRYRGYCVEDMGIFEGIFSEFNTKKEAIYSLYAESNLLDEKYVKSTIRFLDAFYLTINNPKRAKLDFQYPCLSNGTGNVVIKGLN